MRATKNESPAPVKRRPSRRCSEPDGLEIVHGVGTTAHEVMIDQTGECPWCGEEG